MMAAIFGTILVASFAEIFLSRVLEHARRIITPLVSGIVVTLIGLTLIQVGLVSMGGGYAALNEGTFGSLDKLALAGTVLGLIVILNRSKNPEDNRVTWAEFKECAPVMVRSTGYGTVIGQPIQQRLETHYLPVNGIHRN